MFDPVTQAFVMVRTGPILLYMTSEVVRFLSQTERRLRCANSLIDVSVNVSLLFLNRLVEKCD